MSDEKLARMIVYKLDCAGYMKLMGSGTLADISQRIKEAQQIVLKVLEQRQP